MAALPERWGEGLAASYFLPDDPNPERTQEWFGRLQMMSATPRDAIAFMRMAFDIDVRDVVSAVHVPTLVLHRVGDNICHVENGRFLAARSQMRSTSSCPATCTSRGPATRPTSSTRSASSSPACARRTSPTACSRRCSSPTSSARRSARPQLGDRRWRELLDAHHAAVRRELERFRGREIDTAGDGFLASFDGPARAIRCAEAAVESVRGLGLDIRAGVHTGECELHGGKLAGIAVHIGARVAGQAGPGEVLVSSTVRDLVAGSGLEFEDRGSASLKGVPGEWRLYAVSGEA